MTVEHPPKPARSRKVRTVERLTDRAVATAKPASKPKKLPDGNGLYLLVKTTGSKLWRHKYRFQGKEKLAALGQYPEVGLALARERRDANRKQLAEGRDPVAEKQEERARIKSEAENTFEKVAAQWFEQWKSGKTQRHANQVWRRLAADVFPMIGSKPIAGLRVRDIIAVVKAIEARGTAELALRALQNCKSVNRYAMQHELVESAVCDSIQPRDILKARDKKNMARIPANELPALLRAIEGYRGTPITRLAMKLMSLTFVRTSELIQARWTEFDLDKAVWTIPAERMKARRAHFVPLSRQAIEVLRVLHSTTHPLREHVFPGERSPLAAMSNNTILKALERMGYKGRMTGHGFRGIASTELNETLQCDPRHIEAQLAHMDSNQVRAAYNHAEYMPQRRVLMQAWADHLDSLREVSVPRTPALALAYSTQLASFQNIKQRLMITPSPTFEAVNVVNS